MRVAICDDDESCLKTEEEMIKETFAQLGISAQTEIFNNPLELLNGDLKYDIVFLDVEMNGMSGIEAADKIHSLYKNALIFFVTNYEGYMDEALNRHAFRFWVKPINKQRLIYGIESAVKEINDTNIFLQVTVNKKLVRIPMRDIIFAYAEHKMTSIVTAEEEFVVKEAFRDVMQRLNADYFCSSHASYCVNLNYVIRYNDEEVICRHGDKIYTAYMSKRKYQSFSKRFAEWAGEMI